MTIKIKLITLIALTTLFIGKAFSQIDFVRNDSIIVLAWPEAMVAGANSWYDKYLSTKGKYRVGHSALILVNHEKEKLFYFDNQHYLLNQ